jgi:DNA-binding transcriptional ArsR family regulator
MLKQMNPSDRRNAALVFQALAVEKRLEIVQLLAKRTLCVGALSNLLDVSPGAISQHLRILKNVGLVRSDRRGYFIHYGLAPDIAKRCRAAMDSLCGTKPEPRKRGRKCAAERRSAKGRKS